METGKNLVDKNIESYLYLGEHTDDNVRFANMAAERIVELIYSEEEKLIIIAREGTEGIEKDDLRRLSELIRQGMRPSQAHIQINAEKLRNNFILQYPSEHIPEMERFMETAKIYFDRYQSEFTRLHLKAIDSMLDALANNQNIELIYLPETVENSEEFERRKNLRTQIDFYTNEFNNSLNNKDIPAALVFLKNGIHIFAQMNREREISLSREIISAIENSDKKDVKIFTTFGQSHNYISQYLRTMSNHEIKTHNIYEQRSDEGKVYSSASDSLMRKLIINPDAEISDLDYLKVVILDHIEKILEEENQYPIQTILKAIHEVSRSEMFKDVIINGEVQITAEENATRIFLENFDNPVEILRKYSKGGEF